MKRSNVRCPTGRPAIPGFLAGAVLLLAFGLSACSQKKSGPAGAKGPPANRPPVPVLVATAIVRDVPVEVRTVGNVQAFSTVAVRSRITGQLFKVHFKDGDEVKAGDLLFTIDPRSTESALRQAQANAKRDEAQFESARLDFERVQKLAESGIASRDEYDKAQAAFHALEAGVLADHAAVSNAALNVEYTRIRSPLTGRAGNILVKEGNIAKSEDDILVTINQVHPIYVTFAVPEQELPAIRARARESGLRVAVSLPDSTNVLATGELSFIDNAVDAATGTILLKGTFENEDNALWPGQFVQVRLVVKTLKDAIVVPSQAVQSSQTGEFVFVVGQDQAVEKRNVLLGVTQEGSSVIERGVKPGEIVVTDGQMRLVPKAKVAVQRAEPRGGNHVAKAPEGDEEGQP
jgi:multidrug efflux system membrane fusion protein